jgi:hypothetical protein
MQQLIKRFLWVGGLALGLQTAWGFALLGPNTALTGYTSLGTSGDPWQTIELGYDMVEYYGIGEPGGGVWLGDIGGPKNLGQEYRRNVPVIYYAYDGSFSGWFGPAGEDAVDQAFAIMNSLTNVDSYSSDLHEFPFQSQTFNYMAQGLYLTDLKSVALHLLVEQMGLTEPERYTWTLHDLNTLPGSAPCPENHDYLVVQRNFDVVPSPLNQPQYSPYVNNVLYNYFIEDDCNHHPPDWSAITVPRGSDPSAELYTSVAANNYAGLLGEMGAGSLSLIYMGGLQVGGFYTGLTRDDVGGLRYLLSTNNVNYEAPAVGSLLTGATTIGVTNLGPQILLYTSNYTAFWLTAQITDPVTLSNLFPGLVVVNAPYYWTNIVTPNVVAYITNLIGSPYGSQVLVVTTNGSSSSTNLQIYSDTYANLIVTTNGYHTNTSASLMTFSILPQVGAPAGSPFRTNTSFKTLTLTNVPSGEYYINTNYLCGPPLILSTLATNITATTNFLYAASNSAGEFISQSLVIYSTTHVYVVQQPICSTTSTGGGLTNSPGFFQGIGRVRFVRVPDNQMYPNTHALNPPITTTYTMVLFNPATSQLETRSFQRTLNTPDIIITAADLANGQDQSVFDGTVTRSIPTYEVANRLNGLCGPGVIDGQTTFTFNMAGPVFWNGPFSDTNGFSDEVNETTQTPALQWASFDSSTNIILYPNGTTLKQLQDEMVIKILPASLPDYTNSVGGAYPTITFSATGGTSPYTWTQLTPQDGLPYGLSFSTNGVLSGTPSGNNPGIYDFLITVTDSSGQATGSPGRVVPLNYTITIH